MTPSDIQGRKETRTACGSLRLLTNGLALMVFAILPTVDALASRSGSGDAASGSRGLESTRSVAIVGQSIVPNAFGAKIWSRIGATPGVRGARNDRMHKRVASGKATRRPPRTSARSHRMVGDFDHDGDVDVADALLLYEGFSASGRPTRLTVTDLDRDGDTDLADMILFQAAYTGPR